MSKAGQALYRDLYAAYAKLNRALFRGKLPGAIITLHRRRGAYGFFAAECYRGEKAKQDEIALNPVYLRGRPSKDVLSTLLHEMVHQWQKHHGDYFPTRPYHNREWAAKMKEVGLQPVNPITGRETGVRVGHTIIKRGAFDLIAASILKGSSIGTLSALPFADEMAKGPRRPSGYAKFECPACDAKARAVPGAVVFCAGNENGGTHKPHKMQEVG